MAEKKMKRIDKIRETLVDDIFTIEELENIMEGFGYSAVEDVAGSVTNDNEKFYLSFTNGASEVRIEPESYDGNCVLIGKWSNDTKDKPEELRKSSIVINTRKTGEPTKVRVFQSYDDLAAIMRYFKENIVSSVYTKQKTLPMNKRQCLLFTAYNPHTVPCREQQLPQWIIRLLQNREDDGNLQYDTSYLTALYKHIEGCLRHFAQWV